MFNWLHWAMGYALFAIGRKFRREQLDAPVKMWDALATLHSVVLRRHLLTNIRCAEITNVSATSFLSLAFHPFVFGFFVPFCSFFIVANLHSGLKSFSASDSTLVLYYGAIALIGFIFIVCEIFNLQSRSSSLPTTDKQSPHHGVSSSKAKTWLIGIMALALTGLTIVIIIMIAAN
jgi:hypothetical protein